MNISDIDEVASRKKINENAGKIREKVNRENAKIIKMKVAQDTSYWDLKEKLRQLEGNLERLQQNMVELQMQYETVSMKYQDELRLRSETLNNVASVKALVDVMEEYISKVSGTFVRTHSDCGALANAYASASSTVSDLHDQYLKLQHTKADEAREFSARFMEDLAAKSMNETRAAMSHVADVLHSHQSDVIQKNEQTISRLQAEVKQLTEDLNAQKCKMQTVVANYEIKVVGEARTADELRANVRTAEECVNILRDQLTAVERERILLQQIVDNTKRELQESAATVEQLNRSLVDVKNENEKFVVTIAEKNQIIVERQEFIDKLSNEMATLSVKYAEIDSSLIAVQLEKQAEAMKVEQMNEETRTLRKQLSDIEEEFKKYTQESERKAASTRNIISGLMGEVQAAARTTDNMKTEIHTLKANAAAEQDTLREEEAKQRARADNLDFSIKSKDKEIADLKAIMQEKDKEIEWLKSKIRAMQNTIDNIQKELTARLQVGSSKRDKRSERPERLEREQQPKVAKRNDFEIYNFFSNSSSDSDALPIAVVRNQFDALAKHAKDNFNDGKTGSHLSGDKIGNDSGITQESDTRNAGRGQSPISGAFSEVRNEVNSKKRLFFKNKNTTTKGKKIK